MMLDRLTLAGEKREVARRAAILSGRRVAAQAQQGQFVDTVERRIRRPESLALALVAGMTLAMITPQRRRGQADSKRRPVLNNQALRRGLTLVRGLLLTRLLALLREAATG